jgi:hypothetical protein
MVLQAYLSGIILKYAQLYIKGIEADLNIWGTTIQNGDYSPVNAPYFM